MNAEQGAAPDRDLEVDGEIKLWGRSFAYVQNDQKKFFFGHFFVDSV